MMPSESLTFWNFINNVRKYLFFFRVTKLRNNISDVKMTLSWLWLTKLTMADSYNFFDVGIRQRLYFFTIANLVAVSVLLVFIVASKFNGEFLIIDSILATLFVFSYIYLRFAKKLLPASLISKKSNELEKTSQFLTKNEYDYHCIEFINQINATLSKIPTHWIILDFDTIDIDKWTIRELAIEYPLIYFLCLFK